MWWMRELLDRAGLAERAANPLHGDEHEGASYEPGTVRQARDGLDPDVREREEVRAAVAGSSVQAGVSHRTARANAHWSPPPHAAPRGLALGQVRKDAAQNSPDSTRACRGPCQYSMTGAVRLVLIQKRDFWHMVE